MKIATSYYYQIRFFKPNMIPVSTALAPPKWYYRQDGKNRFSYLDKNNVVNGLECKEFAPGPLCAGLCHGKDGCGQDPNSCAFLRMYRAQLETTIDIDDFWYRCERIAKKVQDLNGYTEEPIIVLMVHEASDNPCSERAAIQDFFKSHHIECEELEYPII